MFCKSSATSLKSDVVDNLRFSRHNQSSQKRGKSEKGGLVVSQFFSVAANVLIVVVMVIYFKQVVKGVSVPNPSAWLIWIIIGLMNMVSYFLVVRGDLWQSLITIVTFAGFIFIFVYATVKGKFAGFSKADMFYFIPALVVGVIWQTTGNADLANISLQIVYLLSYLPIVHGLLSHRLREKSLPWNLASISYCLMILAIVTADSWRWIALVHPIANGIVGNGSVILAIHLQARKTRKAK